MFVVNYAFIEYLSVSGDVWLFSAKVLDHEMRKRKHAASPGDDGTKPTHLPDMPKEVRSLKEAFAWVPFVLGQTARLVLKSDAEHGYNKWLQGFATTWFALSFSTASSGIGAPDQAMHMISCMLMFALGSSGFEVRKRVWD